MEANMMAEKRTCANCGKDCPMKDEEVNLFPLETMAKIGLRCEKWKKDD
jgi:hypothetical protein